MKNDKQDESKLATTQGANVTQGKGSLIKKHDREAQVDVMQMGAAKAIELEASARQSGTEEGLSAAAKTGVEAADELACVEAQAFFERRAHNTRRFNALTEKLRAHNARMTAAYGVVDQANQKKSPLDSPEFENLFQ